MPNSPLRVAETPMPVPLYPDTPTVSSLPSPVTPRCATWRGREVRARSRKTERWPRSTDPTRTELVNPWAFNLTHGAHNGTREQPIEES